MKRRLKRGAIDSVPLLNAVLCADCECISESRSDVCGVCGGRSLSNLGRLLGSAMQTKADVPRHADPSGTADAGRFRPSASTQVPRVLSPGPTEG